MGQRRPEGVERRVSSAFRTRCREPRSPDGHAGCSGCPAPIADQCRGGFAGRSTTRHRPTSACPVRRLRGPGASIDQIGSGSRTHSAGSWVHHHPRFPSIVSCLDPGPRPTSGWLSEVPRRPWPTRRLRPRSRHPLHLPARQLARRHDGHGRSSRPAPATRRPGRPRRRPAPSTTSGGCVLDGAQHGHQVEELEDEPEVPAPECGPRHSSSSTGPGRRRSRCRGPGRPVPGDMQQGRFAGPDGPVTTAEFACVRGEIESTNTRTSSRPGGTSCHAVELHYRLGRDSPLSNSDCLTPPRVHGCSTA